MKRLLVLLLLFLPLFAFTETVQIDSPYGKQDLVVPADYQSLRAAYVKMAGLYLSERFDHEKSLKEVDDLLGEIGTLNNLLDQQKDLVKSLSIALDNQDVWINSMLVGGGGTLRNGTIQPNILAGYQGIYKRKVMFEVLAQYPASLSVLIGWRF